MIPPASPETLTAMGSAGGRFGRGFQQLRNAPATWQLLRIMIVMQAVPVIWDLVFPPGHSEPDKLSQAQIFLGLTKPHFLHGDFWQPLTYALIHADWSHLLLNGATILLLGSKLEHIAGMRMMQVLAIAAALAGGFLSLLLTPTLETDPLVGSSAVCFGFLLMLTTLSPDSRFLPFFVSGRSLGMGVILTNLILALMHPDLPTGPLARFGADLSEKQFPGLFRVGHACHLGGSVVGWLTGRLLLRQRVSIVSLRKARAKREGKAQKS